MSAVKPLGQVKYHDDDPDLDFEEVLGWFKGVAARSNVDASFFSGESHFVDGVYSGYKYQCVEFARRFLLTTKGVIFSDCLRASEIFDKNEVENVETGEKYPLLAHKNGETTVKPEPGMVLIYPYVEGPLPWGHVAIISAVGDDWVGIAEQNIENKSWRGEPYGRKARLLRDADTGAWTIEEVLPATDIRPCRGWMSIEGKPDRPTTGGEGHRVTYAPLNVLEQYKKPRGDWAFDRWDMPRVAVDPERTSAPDVVRTILAERPAAADATPAPGGVYPRVRESQSMYEPTEEAGICQIPSAIWSFRLVGEAHRAIVAGITSDAEVSTRYGIPARYVAAARRQLSDFRHGSLIGSLDLLPQPEQRRLVLAAVHSESMATYADMSMNVAFTDANGQPEGMKMATTNEDLGRAVRLIAQRKHLLEHRKGDVNTIVYVLSVGDAQRMPLNKLLAPETAAAVHTEQLHMKFAVAQWNKYLEERAEALSKGELNPEDAPVFAVQEVSLFDDAVVIAEDGITVNGKRADFVWKVEPWAALWQLEASAAAKEAAGFGKLQQFLDFVAADKHVVPTVFQPLWAPIFDAPGAVRDAVAWLNSEAAPAAIKALCAPVAADPSAFDAATGRLTLPLCAPRKTGPMKKRFREQYARSEEDEIGVAVRSFIADGLSGAGLVLEARRRPGAAAAQPLRLEDAVNSGVAAFGFGMDFGAEPDEEQQA